jgi:hypothetical protein
MASVWVPFTSESKEAIADYDEIRKEMKLALMECGRKLGTYLRKRQKMRRESERRDVFERYIGEISKALNAITGEDTRKLYDALLEQARQKTAVADQELDEDGKVKKQADESLDDEGVIIVSSAIAPIEEAAPTAPIDFDEPSKATTAARGKGGKGGKPEPKPAKRSEPEIKTKKDLASGAQPGKGASKDTGKSTAKGFTDDDPRLF